ncbi:MAG TPA: metallophosphoesterase [Xanthomonadales bacterium]|nr:metallophosphoesterase [Xanthomonadales bacterium]
MKLISIPAFRRLCSGLSLLLLTACAATNSPTDNQDTDNPGGQNAATGVLIFGDGGYHLMYPDQEDFVELFSTEEYLQSEWDSWLEDRRPAEEFEAAPSAISPVTGKTVMASGMNGVSQAMKNFCRDTAQCDFGVMLGDNIYPSGATLGADGKDDAQRFYDNLTAPFGKLASTNPDYTVYVTLGNHDWETSRAGGFAQIEFLEQSEDFYMDGPFYSVKPPAGKGEIELFVIDTSMMLASTTVYEDFLDENAAEVVTDVIAVPNYHVEPLTEAEKDMASWLETALQNSTAKWKIVLAHHPIWSSSGSKFEQGRALRELILPAMCRYADALLVGHDHTLEVHTDDCSAALGQATAEPLTQIVSGAAAKQRPVNTNFIRQQDLKYPSHKTVFAKGLLWGFAHMQIEGDEARVQLLSIPDDGSSAITVEYEFQFRRRSGP